MTPRSRPSRRERRGGARVPPYEAIRVFERVAGRTVRRYHVPRFALRAGMRALRRSRPELPSVMGLALLADARDASWTDAPLRALGIAPRGVAPYAEQVLLAERTRADG